MIKKIHKTEEEWRMLLSPEVFAITRGAGTEPAFNNAYWHNEEPGVYKCSNCDLTLFNSKDKFDSGTGWPSFSKPISEDHVVYRDDKSFGMVRTEAECARCGSHLGHVFEDGPNPLGLRFCMNSAALVFVPSAK